MKTARVTRTTSTATSHLTRGVLFLAVSIVHIWSGIDTSNWTPALAGFLFLGLSIVDFKQWAEQHWGAWRIQWKGSHIGILDDNHLVFDGQVTDLYRIDQDGRGYFLHLSRHVVFRLRRGKTDSEFETILDSHQAEQNAAEQPPPAPAKK